MDRPLVEFANSLCTLRQIELDDRIASRGVLTVPFSPDRDTDGDTNTANQPLRIRVSSIILSGPSLITSASGTYLTASSCELTGLRIGGAAGARWSRHRE
jgi:hypothetical protein